MKTNYSSVSDDVVTPSETASDAYVRERLAAAAGIATDIAVVLVVFGIVALLTAHSAGNADQRLTASSAAQPFHGQVRPSNPATTGHEPLTPTREDLDRELRQ